jgi:hypothetical protein
MSGLVARNRLCVSRSALAKSNNVLDENGMGVSGAL